MKFLKKAVSALLASIMCIPAGILNFAEAEEENTVTTVTLADTENGIMQFSEDSMESSTASQDGYHMVPVNEAGELEQVENDGPCGFQLYCSRVRHLGDLSYIHAFPCISCLNGMV